MDFDKIFTALLNCITEPKCKDCPWEKCEQFNQKKVSIPVTLALDVLNLLKEKEPKKGHWIGDETEIYNENHDTWECSECHEPFTLNEGTPEENKFYFCPRCGADMR